MKTAISFSLLLACSFTANATNYYLSNTGSDSNSGTSSSSPWQTITKLNTVSYAPGDTVFFKCNHLFRGNIVVNQGGNNSSPVVFTAYGIGNKPVISGAQLLTGWTASGNFYTAPYTGSVTNFFVNDKEQTLARYPNEHSYLTLDSAQTAYLKDASLSALNSNLITGSRICVHSSQWSWEKAPVSSFSGTMISFGNTMLQSINNYGYFLYDNLNHLDTVHEWKLDATADLMYYYPEAGVNPNALTCEVSVFQNGIEFGPNVKHVTISGLKFEKQANAGIQVSSASDENLIVDNCSFSGQYNHGINFKGRHGVFSNCSFRDIDGIGVYINGSGSGATTVDHNSFRNIGVTRANGLGGQLNGTALMCAADSNYFHHNDFDSSGYCGISADGAYNLIERNVIDHAMLIENDGAALKGWGSVTTQSIYRNNFITNSDGCTEGAYQASFITPAIYFDFNVNNCTISANTVYNHSKKGIFQNSSNFNNTITENVIQGGSQLIDLNGSSLAPSAVPITGMVIKHNTFFAKDNSSVIIRQVDYSNNFNAGTLDSNHYVHPYNPNRYALRMNGATPVYYTFANWQTTGNDPNSVDGFVSWVYPESHDTLFKNISDNAVTIDLGADQYLDLDSNEVCGSIVLEPYTSKLLINTGAICANAGLPDGSEQLPVVVYPNPASNELHLVNAADFTAYEIIDGCGRIIQAGHNRQHEAIQVGELVSGIYLLHLTGERDAIIRWVKTATD